MPTLRILLVMPVVFLCSGCFFWYSSKLPLSSPRSDIEDQMLKSIVVGATTLEEVLLRLGEPQEHFDAPTVFLYRWVRVRSFFFVMVAPAPGGVGGFASQSGTEYTLHIAFDENNKVSLCKLSKL